MSVTYILLYLLIGVLSVAFYFVRRKFNYWKDRGIPYDEPHPIYGSFRNFRKNCIIQDVHFALYKKFKGVAPFVGIFFFQRPTAYILDRQLAKNILIKDFPVFADRGGFYNERDDPLSAHLFALDGVKWKQLRQKLSPTFTSGKMKFMFPTVVKVAEQFVHVLNDLLKEGNNFDVKELSARFTTDVIGTCAFGIECNSLKDPNAEFRTMGRNALSLTRHSAPIMALIQSHPKWARKLGMRKVHQDIHNFFMRIVHETVELRESQNIKRNDFMDLLIELKKTKSIKLDNGEELTGLTVNEVAAQAFVFFLAGFETSSTAMSYTLYELAKNQVVQDKLRKEVNEVLAKHNQEFTYECLKEMHYLDQVLFEILRLYTIVPHLMRQPTRDYVVPGHPKLVIEKGTFVMIPSSAYHHDPEVYPEPAKFDPDRFSPEKVQDRDNINWLPFGDGPRNCIGLRFGKMQARIGLALLMKNFKFSVCEETQIPIVFDVTSFVLSAKDGIHLRVEKI
ncbi:cytochrome P450 6a2-like [Teleopsis dalmanni]|uniref:cytochrome P450 6a2-like n=1 Tax=Teleopsis dalmanni TaxID=139649 RepID=UPI0018CE40FD|nr:cytochrome P450 6a2-like [Teleopsis dalmanni]